MNMFYSDVFSRYYNALDLKSRKIPWKRSLLSVVYVRPSTSIMGPLMGGPQYRMSIVSKVNVPCHVISHVPCRL